MENAELLQTELPKQSDRPQLSLAIMALMIAVSAIALSAILDNRSKHYCSFSSAATALAIATEIFGKSMMQLPKILFAVISD